MTLDRYDLKNYGSRVAKMRAGAEPSIVMANDRLY
jgi:hypothetical protein